MLVDVLQGGTVGKLVHDVGVPNLVVKSTRLACFHESRPVTRKIIRLCIRIILAHPYMKRLLRVNTALDLEERGGNYGVRRTIAAFLLRKRPANTRPPLYAQRRH